VNPAFVHSNFRHLLRGYATFESGPERELCFTEPNLRFEHVETSDGDMLAIAFSQESSPPWATEGERYGEGYALSFPFCRNDFAAASSTLDGMLLKWPIRTHRPG